MTAYLQVKRWQQDGFIACRAPNAGQLVGLGFANGFQYLRERRCGRPAKNCLLCARIHGPIEFDALKIGTRDGIGLIECEVGCRSMKLP